MGSVQIRHTHEKKKQDQRGRATGNMQHVQLLGLDWLFKPSWSARRRRRKIFLSSSSFIRQGRKPLGEERNLENFKLLTLLTLLYFKSHNYAQKIRKFYSRKDKYLEECTHILKCSNLSAEIVEANDDQPLWLW